VSENNPERRRDLLETWVRGRHFLIRGEGMLGSVKFYSVDKGFGFVAPDEGPPDIFINKRAVEAAGLDDLRPGDRLSFFIEIGPDGRQRATKLAVTVSIRAARQSRLMSSRPISRPFRDTGGVR
jgi:CspA family cold shock protein